MLNKPSFGRSLTEPWALVKNEEEEETHIFYFIFYLIHFILFTLEFENGQTHKEKLVLQNLTKGIDRFCSARDINNEEKTNSCFEHTFPKSVKIKARTVRGLEGHGSGGQAAHEPGHQQLDVGHPGDGDVGQALGRHAELVPPLVVTAVRVEQELELRACVERHLLMEQTKYQNKSV